MVWILVIAGLGAGSELLKLLAMQRVIVEKATPRSDELRSKGWLSAATGLRMLMAAGLVAYPGVWLAWGEAPHGTPPEFVLPERVFGALCVVFACALILGAVSKFADAAGLLRRSAAASADAA